MQRCIGQVTIETIAAESPKFSAELLCVHGLWCTAAVWRRFMGFFAHRGWASHALTLRGHGASAGAGSIAGIRYADYCRDVDDVIAACAAPPVLIGHDLGGLLALASASRARAVVALAPLVPGPRSAATRALWSPWRVRLAIRRVRPLPPPRGRLGAAYFGAAPPGGTTLESSTVVRELGRDEIALPAPGGVPTLIVVGTADAFAPVSDVERLATTIGADVRRAEGAPHAMPWGPGWEQRVGEIHRWLIQTLGDDLLLLREDDEE